MPRRNSVEDSGPRARGGRESTIHNSGRRGGRARRLREGELRRERFRRRNGCKQRARRQGRPRVPITISLLFWELLPSCLNGRGFLLWPRGALWLSRREHGELEIVGESYNYSSRSIWGVWVRKSQTKGEASPPFLAPGGCGASTYPDPAIQAPSRPGAIGSNRPRAWTAESKVLADLH